MWRAPARATILAMIMFGCASWVGTLAGSWIMPIVIAMTTKGVQSLAHLPASDWWFPNVPPWFDQTSKLFMNAAGGSLALAGAIGGLVLGMRCWRYLVVR